MFSTRMLCQFSKQQPWEKGFKKILWSSTWSDYKEDSDAIACTSSGLDVTFVFIPGKEIQGKIWSGTGITFLFKSKFFSTYLSESKLVQVNQERQLMKESEQASEYTVLCILFIKYHWNHCSDTGFILKEGS